MSLLAPKPGSFFDGSYFTKYSSGNVFVSEIWEISRNYANLLVLLFLIWIAINIILGKKEFVNYQYLIKVLVVALLINFSLVICGLLIDISNYLTYLFMSNFNSEGFSCMYTCVIHKVGNIFRCASYKMWFPQTISNVLAAILGMIFVGQLMGLLIFVLIRMVSLWFLVITSPIAFVLGSTPNTYPLYKKWSEFFIANLIKLPVLAIAAFFVLNIMMSVADTIMLTPPQDGEILMATIGVSALLIILSQSLLLVAQNLNVAQISKATSMITSFAKKGVQTAGKSVGKLGTTTLQKSKPWQSLSQKLQSSRFATLAKQGNIMAEKTETAQEETAKDLKGFYDNKNWQHLEALVKNPLTSSSKKIEALKLLALLAKKADYQTTGTKITEDTSFISSFVKSARGNDLLEGELKSLGKILPQFAPKGSHFDAKKGETGVDDLKSADQAKALAKDIGFLMSRPEERKNLDLGSTLKVAFERAAKGGYLKDFIAALQLSVNARDLNSYVGEMKPEVLKDFTHRLAQGTIIANESEGKTADTILKELAEFDKLSSEEKNSKTKKHWSQASKNLSPDHAWTSKKHGGVNNNFYRKLVSFDIIEEDPDSPIKNEKDSYEHSNKNKANFGGESFTETDSGVFVPSGTTQKSDDAEKGSGEAEKKDVSDKVAGDSSPSTEMPGSTEKDASQKMNSIYNQLLNVHDEIEQDIGELSSDISSQIERGVEEFNKGTENLAKNFGENDKSILSKINSLSERLQKIPEQLKELNRAKEAGAKIDPQSETTLEERLKRIEKMTAQVKAQETSKIISQITFYQKQMGRITDPEIRRRTQEKISSLQMLQTKLSSLN